MINMNIQDMVRFYACWRVGQHAPHPFAHRRSRRLRVGLAAVPCWRQTQSVSGGLHLKQKPGLHRLRPGVRRSLIGFPTLAVVPHRQCIPGKLPSPLARSTGSMDLSPTPCVGPTPITL